MSEQNGREIAAVAFINGRYLHRGTQYKEDASEEVVSVHKFEGPVAMIRRGYGLTLNMGNYESARFDVSIELPCHVEDIDAADDFARQWVEARAEAEVAEIRGNGNGKKPSY